MASRSYQLAVDIRDQLTIAQAVCNHQLMVDTQDIKAGFVARLNKALDAIPGVRAGRGRNVDLYEGIRNNPQAKASTQATHKWLSGESMPSRGNMLAIAEWLNVRAEWLAYGEGDMRPTPPVADEQTPRASLLEQLHQQNPRHYQTDLYEAAPVEQREAVDDMAEKMLKLSPEQARKLKQAMDLLMPDNGPNKN